jgi:hypothetical protein
MTVFAISQAVSPTVSPPAESSPADSLLTPSRPRTDCVPAWHAEFLAMLPAIVRHARIAFRGRRGDRLDEAVQEVVCNCCCAYARLVEQGRPHTATWSSLARFAVRQVRDNRQVGTPVNSRDVCAPKCQQKHWVDVCSMFRWVEQDEEWTEMVVSDKHSTPADTAAFRLDFRAFLASLSRRDRRITIKLAEGHATQWVARRFGISPARVSQLRRELCGRWREFIGEAVAPGPEKPAAAS